MKLLYLLLLTIIGSQLAAQQKFIEVNVFDTVLAEADLYVYRITIMPEEDLSRDQLQYKNPVLFNKKVEQQKIKEKRLYDSVILVLKKGGFNLASPATSDTFSIVNKRYNLFSATLILRSFDSLVSMYQLIKNAKHLIGAVEMAKAREEPKYKEALYKKLVEQAIDKAKAIASYTHQKVGNILSVIEVKTDEIPSGGWSAYPPLSALAESAIPGWHTNIFPRNYIITTDPVNNKCLISGSLTVRFEVE